MRIFETWAQAETSAGTDRRISSPESEGGLLHSSLPAGHATSSPGPEAVPVSRSAPRESAADSTTSLTVERQLRDVEDRLNAARRERDEAGAELAAASSVLRPDSVREWCDRAFALAKEKGWWPEDQSPVDRIPEALALIHSEVSEALEAYRNDAYLTMRLEKDGKPEGFVVELADVLLRVFDLCGALGLNLEQALVRKHEFNKTRPYRHGGKKA